MTDKTLDFDSVVEMIEEFPAQVRWAIEHAPDDRMVDVLGTINSTATQIGVMKRSAASEVPDGQTGEIYSIERGRKAMRSYNTPGLIMSIGTQLGHDGAWDTVRMLLFDKTIKIEWSWTRLEKLIKTHNLDLRRARHEIKDDDPEYDFGEYWKDGATRYVPIEESNDWR